MSYPADLARQIGGYFSLRLPGLPVDVATVWVESESGVNNNPVGLTSNGTLIVYDSWQHGIDAAAGWVLNPASPYGALRSALRGGDPYTVMRAVQDSPWGPAGYYHSSWPGVAAALGITLPKAPAVPAGGSPVTLQVVNSTPLPAGTVGHVGAGTRRWALDGTPLSDLTAPSIVDVIALAVLAGPIHGHFFETGTDPGYYVIAAAVPLDDPATDPGTPTPTPAPAPAVIPVYGWVPGFPPTPDLGTGQTWKDGTTPLWAAACRDAEDIAAHAFDPSGAVASDAGLYSGAAAASGFTGVVGQSLNDVTGDWAVFRNGQLVATLIASAERDPVVIAKQYGLPLYGATLNPAA